MASPDGETIQGGTLFKGGHYRIEKGFDRGHYSCFDCCKGRTLIKEIRYLLEQIWLYKLYYLATNSISKQLCSVKYCSTYV